MTTITSLSELQSLLASMPEGTETDILASDLEAGNFETAHFVKPDGSALDVTYTGPVAEGYVSPFEADPCWNGTYVVQGPLPGDHAVVSQEELDRMVAAGETTNCTIFKDRDASHPHFWTHHSLSRQ